MTAAEEPREEPRYHVELVSQFGGGPTGSPGGLQLKISVPDPAAAPRVLRAVADRLELNRLTLEGDGG